MKIIYEDTNQELHEIPLHPKTPPENHVQIMKLNAKITGVEPVRAFLVEEKETEIWTAQS